MDTSEDKDNAFTIHFVIPRAPLWFRCSPLVCFPHENLSDGSILDVLFLSYEYVNAFSLVKTDNEGDNPYTFKFCQKFKSHDETATCIACSTCDSDASPVLCTCGADGYFRTWRRINGVWMLDKQVHLRQELSPTAVSLYSEKKNIFVLGGSSLGHAIIWHIPQNKDFKAPFVKKMEKDAVTCSAWLPSSQETSYLFGVLGFKSGSVSVIKYSFGSIENESNLTIVHRINAHNYEICSLVPLDTGVNKLSFATSGRDSSVKVRTAAFNNHLIASCCNSILFIVVLVGQRIEMPTSLSLSVQTRFRSGQSMDTVDISISIFSHCI